MRAGLGVDLTSMQLAVHNPLDPAEPDFPPSPLLVAATSDAKLRFYTLSHLRRPLAGLVAPATPISAGMPPLAAPDAVPAADAGGGITAAAQGGLPASSDAEEAGVAVAAAAAQLPDSDDESLGENSDSGAAQAELPESSDEEFGRYTSDEEGGSVMAAAAARLPDSDGESFRDGSETESSGVAAAARAGLPESDEESLGEGEQTASSRHPALGSSASKPATSGERHSNERLLSCACSSCPFSAWRPLLRQHDPDRSVQAAAWGTVLHASAALSCRSMRRRSALVQAGERIC